MSESFSIQSRLIISSNADAVIGKLIEDFDRLDNVVREAQTVLTRFGEQAEKLAALKTALRDLKLPSGLKSEAEALSTFTKTTAEFATKATVEFREMAAAVRGLHGMKPPTLPAGIKSEFEAASNFSKTIADFAARSATSWNGAGLRRELESAANFSKTIANFAAQSAASWNSAAAAMRSMRSVPSPTGGAPSPGRQQPQPQPPPPHTQPGQGQGQQQGGRQGQGQGQGGGQGQGQGQQPHTQQGQGQGRGQGHGRGTDIASGLIGLQPLMQGPMEFFKESLKAETDVEKELLLLRHNNEITDEQIRAVRERAMEMDRLVPGTTPEQNVKIILDAFTVTNDLKAAMQAAPVAAEAQMVLQSLPGEHHGDSAYAGMQSIELLQRMYDEKSGKIDINELNKQLMAEVRVAVGTAGRDMPENYLAVAKNSRAAGMTASDKFLFEDLPAVQISMGGSRTGTAMAGGYREFIRGTMTQGVAGELKKLDLLDGHAKWSHGRVEDMKHHLRGYDLMQTNPVDWVREILIPSLQKHHINTRDKNQVESALSQLGSTNVVLGWLSEMTLGMEGINKEAAKLRATDHDKNGNPLNPMDVVKEFSPDLKLKEFEGSVKELQTVLGEFLIGPGNDALKQLTGGLRELTDWLKANPDVGSELTKVAAGLTVLGYAVGGIAAFAFLAGPVLTSVRAIAGLSGGLVTLGARLLPFAAGGSGASGLAGLAAGLGPLTAAIVAAYIALKPNTSIASQRKEDQIIGKANADEHRFDSFGRAKGLTDKPPGVMGYFENLFDPRSYYHDPRKADSLVAPTAPTASDKGTATNPVVVHVQNGTDLAKGVTSFQADKSNRPPSGFTGSDPRMDPLSAFYGMMTAPY